jgi:hypothetical protein
MIDESEFEPLGLVCSRAGMTDLSWYYALPFPKRLAVDREANLWAVGIGHYLKNVHLSILQRIVDNVRRGHGV